MQDVKFAVIGNSETITKFDAIIPGSTTHAAAVIGAKSTTGLILGVVTGIYQNGKVLEKNSVTVASNNETVGLISVSYIPAYLPMEYLADLTAAAGTTNYSNLMQMFNLGSSNATLDETSAGVFSTQLQFFSYGTLTTNGTQVTGVWAKFV